MSPRLWAFRTVTPSPARSPRPPTQSCCSTNAPPAPSGDCRRHLCPGSAVLHKLPSSRSQALLLGHTRRSVPASASLLGKLEALKANAEGSPS